MKHILKCETCKFWRHQTDTTSAGLCHRSPPKPASSVKSSHVVWAHWPRTSAHDFCGDYFWSEAPPFLEESK